MAARPIGSVAARNRSPLQVRTALLPSTDGATRRPKTSPPAASAESGSSSAKPGKSGKSTGATGRSTSVLSALSDSRSVSGRLQVVSPKASARENSATRVAARPIGSVAARNCSPLQVRTALLPSTDGPPGDRRRARRPRQQSWEARRPSQANQENGLVPLGGRHPWQ